MIYQLRDKLQEKLLSVTEPLSSLLFCDVGVVTWHDELRNEARLDKELPTAPTARRTQLLFLQQVWWYPGNPVCLWPIWYTIVSETRTRRQVSGDPVYYRITDSTHIIKVQLKNLQSHKNTKTELTAFLAKIAEQRAKAIEGKIVMEWETECNVSHKYMRHLPEWSRRSKYRDDTLCSWCYCWRCYALVRPFTGNRCPCSGNQKISRDMY